MNMEWTKNLSKPFKYEENMSGKIEVVYVYTYIAVGKHIDGHWRLYGMFHNNQGKRPKIVPDYYKWWNMVPTENCLCHNGYSDYKIKGKKLVLCQDSKMAYRFQSLPNGDLYDDLDRIRKADEANKELQHTLKYLHNLGLETYVNYEIQQRWWINEHTRT